MRWKMEDVSKRWSKWVVIEQWRLSVWWAVCIGGQVIERSSPIIGEEEEEEGD